MYHLKPVPVPPPESFNALCTYLFSSPEKKAKRDEAYGKKLAARSGKAFAKNRERYVMGAMSICEQIRAMVAGVLHANTQLGEGQWVRDRKLSEKDHAALNSILAGVKSVTLPCEVFKAGMQPFYDFVDKFDEIPRPAMVLTIDIPNSEYWYPVTGVVFNTRTGSYADFNHFMQVAHRIQYFLGCIQTRFQPDEIRFARTKGVARASCQCTCSC